MTDTANLPNTTKGSETALASGTTNSSASRRTELGAQGKPRRVQLRRTKGWRMPENTVSVARPTMFGNPYWDVRRYGLNLCLQAFRNTATGYWTPGIVPEGHPHRNSWLDWLYKDHTEWLERIHKFYGHPTDAVRCALRGKNLACWCALDKPCHADILLEIANG